MANALNTDKCSVVHIGKKGTDLEFKLCGKGLKATNEEKERSRGHLA